MITFLRTDSRHPEFIKLVQKLDNELAIRDGEDHDFYHQFNNIDTLKHALVAYFNDVPIGCGAIKSFNDTSVEVKRMYVLPQHRKKGVAKSLITELETWAKELGYMRCVLETGKKQTEAMHLYHKQGYTILPNYGPYQGVENSVCFEKIIT